MLVWYRSVSFVLFKRRSPLFNPRTYKQWGGGGDDGSPPWIFAVLQYFEKILPLIKGLLCIVALLGASDAIQDSEESILTAILDFTQNTKLSKKR